jgi:hypothetical protein
VAGAAVGAATAAAAAVAAVGAATAAAAAGAAAIDALVALRSGRFVLFFVLHLSVPGTRTLPGPRRRGDVLAW